MHDLSFTGCRVPQIYSARGIEALERKAKKKLDFQLKHIIRLYGQIQFKQSVFMISHFISFSVAQLKTFQRMEILMVIRMAFQSVCNNIQINHGLRDKEIAIKIADTTN